MIVRRAFSFSLFLSLIIGFSAQAAAKFNPKDTASQLILVLNELSFADRDENQEIVNDKMSERGLGIFLKDLDSRKMYFLQSDVDRFHKSYEHSLDDELKNGDLTAVKDIAAVYIQRLKESVEAVTQATAQTPDFTVNESLNLDSEKREYAKTEAEFQSNWRQRAKYDWLQLRQGKTEEAKIGETIVKRQTRTLTTFEKLLSNDEKLFELSTTALLRTLDPHSTYMSPASAENFRIQVAGNLQGIGASLSKEDGEVTVMSLVKGGAAEKDGTLKKGDIISAVAQGDNGAFQETAPMELDAVVQLIRGKAGSKLRLRITGVDKSVKELTLIRQAVKLEDSTSTAKTISVKSESNGKDVKVGVVQIPSFYGDPRTGEGLTKDVIGFIEQFKKDSVEVIVVDLRGNGGGLLTEAISLTGLFIDKGPVVQVKSADGQTAVHSDEDAGVAWDKPLVVLSDRHSASASEIFAGTIKAYRRGLTLGDDTTHGKGTVQTMIPLESKGLASLFGGGNKASGMVKMTIQQFFLPDGQSTQEIGVPSQVILPSLYNGIDTGESTLEYHVKGATIPAAKSFSAVDGYWKDTYAPELSKASEARRSKSPAFVKFQEKAKAIEGAFNRKSVPLEEKAYEAMVKSSKEDLADAEEEEPAKSKDDAQLDEALQIGADYLELLSK